MYEYQKRAIVREFQSDEFSDAVEVAKTMMDADEVVELALSKVHEMDSIQLSMLRDAANSQLDGITRLALAQLNSK